MDPKNYLEQKKETIGENLFMKKLLKKRFNQKGLTLIELLAVIVILAIVAAIAVPAIGNLVENSRYNAVKADALNVLSAANIYFSENPDDADKKVSVNDLKLDKLLDTGGKIPDTAEVTRPASGGLGLTTTAGVSYGNNTVKFTGATVDSINADKTKGSSGANKEITSTSKANNDVAAAPSGG